MNFLMVLLMAGFIGGTAGYIGSLMVTKRMALTGGALGHLTLPGIALGLIYGFDVSIGAFIFLAFGITLIWVSKSRSDLPMEAITAVVFASSVSIAFLFLPKEKTVPALIGSAPQVSWLPTIIVVGLCVVIFFLTRRIYPRMLLSSISEDVAVVEGVNIGKLNFIYLFGIALTVALGVRIVGSLLTAALVAIPASASRNLTKNHFQYSYGALVIGVVSSVLGVIIYKLTGPSVGSITVGSPGPFIIITSSIFFLVSLIFKRIT